MKRIIAILTAILSIPCLYAQDKELLIIGTMHDVPKIVSHCYRPLLKQAKKYQPEAIYVEYNRPDDTLSMKNYTPRFLNLADSLLKVHDIDEHRFLTLKAKSLFKMNADDYAFLAETYLLKKDRANHIYYDYLKTYGTVGPQKPLREETGNLTIPLAIAMGITELIPIDDHQTEKEYQRAWSNAVKSGRETGDDIVLSNCSKKTVGKGFGLPFWESLENIPISPRLFIASTRSTHADMQRIPPSKALQPNNSGMPATIGWQPTWQSKSRPIPTTEAS